MKNLTDILFLMRSVGLLCVLVIVTVGNVQAQHPLTPVQSGQFRSFLNPAFSLMDGGGELSTVGRRQWVGIEGSPTVFWGRGHVGFERLGATAGVNLRHESLGVESLTESSLFFAKSVRLSAQDYLGVSLSTGLIFHQGLFSELDSQDPAFRDDIRSTDGMIGFGLVFYRPEGYYAGVSLPRMVISNGDDQNRYELRPHYHFTAGGLIPLGVDFHMRPSVLLTYASNLGTEVDFSAMFFLQRQFGLGVNVRTTGDLSGMLEFRFGGLGLGYGYQFHPGSAPMNRRIENSTHEIGLSYRFGSQQGLL